jgi:hypothetical protein
MKAKFYIRLIMVCAGFFLYIGIAYTQQVHLEIPIVDGNDDAEEAAVENPPYYVEGEITRTSSDLELYWDDIIQYVGVLFRDVQVPPGMVVDSAYIQFVAKQANDEEVTLHIWGVDSVTVDSIWPVLYGISGNAPTTATVDWSPDPWIVEYDTKPAQQTPDLKTIVDEIVAKEGWESGNNMMFVLTGDVDEEKIRNAYSYDMDGYGPTLHIWFGGGGSTGQKLIQSSDFRTLVYPNPTEGRLYINNSSSDKFNYYIYSITGKLVRSGQNISDTRVDIDMSTLTKGIYLINVINKEQTETHKVILK